MIDKVRSRMQATEPSEDRSEVPGAPAFECPKCHGVMRTYARGGLILELCEDCRGIFLDKGELERLIDAEGGGWSGIVSSAIDPRH